MKVKALYKVGDTVKVLGCNTPMLITGFVLDDNGYIEEYEIVPVESLSYCTETAIIGLESEND